MDRTARAVPLELVMRHSMVAEWAQALRCVTLGLSTSCVCPLPAFVHFLRLFTASVCSLPLHPRPDGLRRSARIGHAAFYGSGMGASPPVCHVGSVHFLRLLTACVCSLTAFVHCRHARHRTARAVPLELVMRHSMVAEWAQAGLRPMLCKQFMANAGSVGRADQALIQTLKRETVPERIQTKRVQHGGLKIADKNGILNRFVA